MAAETHSRGHKIRWNILKAIWVWTDTNEEIDDSRPCKRCEKLPTKEGHDACLGHIPGLTSACCGHGVEEPYRMGDKP